MGVRVTGISTPLGGVSWEYTDKKEEKLIPRRLTPNQKIKVFISSICGKEKYDKVRAELKDAIEATQLAVVYTFEGEGASTLPAGTHYTLALEDSDICIFLIDNADGIPPGVQNEIDTVEKNKIKALYYFCDETQKEKTQLEQSLMGAHFAKSKVVHSFSELTQNGAQDLVDDIVNIYHYYCIGKIGSKTDENDEVQGIEAVGTEKYQMPTIPKTVLKNVDRCSDYLWELILGKSSSKYPDETEKTSEFDDWGFQFLPILFEGKSIKHFNTALYLDTLKEQQDDKYYQVVQIRWQAIQAYFSGDVDKCLEYLKVVLDLSKKTDQPIWVIKDILIDIRNQHLTSCAIKNIFFESSAQQELTESNETLYYPILDRIHESLYEKYIQDLYKKKIESPYTVTIGDNFDQCIEMLASSFILSMYNGSLTHILLIYNQLKDFVFYLRCRYNNWSFTLNLYKFAIFFGKEKEIKGVQASYPEVLTKLNADEAVSIMEFCSNHPIQYKRLSIQMLAFGAVGYFLDDKYFEKYENSIVSKIYDWLDSENPVLDIGKNIFKCLSGAAYRMSQDTLSEICCKFIDKRYIRWYTDMFKFIAEYLDLRKMTRESAEALVDHINSVLDNELDRKQISYAPAFLYIFRKQNIELTNTMDAKTAKYFPKFYKDTYILETTSNDKKDMPIFVRKYVEQIKKDNETQGKNGVYFERGTREIATVRNILLKRDGVCDAETMNALISTVADTLLVSKESIEIKLDAIALLICIAVKFPDDYKHNHSVYDKLYEQEKSIEDAGYSIIFSNIDNLSLKIGLRFLYTAMGKNVYTDILELMPYIGDSTTTIREVTKLIVQYLEISDSVMLPFNVEAIVLQNTLQWLHLEYSDIRYNAIRILFMLSRNAENRGVIDHQLVSRIDSANVNIKSLILRHLYTTKGITNETKAYIIAKCSHDTNYIVRMICKEMKEKNKLE